LPQNEIFIFVEIALMKIVFWSLSILVLGIPSIASSQHTEKELKKHEEAKLKSFKRNKAIVSLDTLFYKGNPICLYIVESTFLGTVMKGTVKNMDGTEAIWTRFVSNQEMPNVRNLSYFEFIFVGSGRKAYVPNTLGGSFEKTIATEGLFKDGFLNPAGEEKLTAQNPMPTFDGSTVVVVQGNGRTQVIQPNVGQNNSPLVQRNRFGTIQISGNLINQDFKQVGNISKRIEAKDGTIYTYYQISLPNGTDLATAIARGATSHEYTVTTFKDNRTFTVNSSIGKDEFDIAKFLIDNGYL
jgi:hypothetical protein